MNEVMCVSLWRNVVITDTAGAIGVGEVKTMEKAFRTLLLTNRQIAGLALLRAGTPVASTDARAETTRFIKDLGAALTLNALVIEDKGVMATMMRSVIRGLNVVMRNSTLVVHGDAKEAVRALVPHLANNTDAVASERELLAALADMRAGFTPGVRRASPSVAPHDN
ncbi:MAG: hypothetical protein HOW73_35425 [Polyangiaceae bacterium]|nr:hypothetical protein [Polyangiaceae bacterium]